MFGVIVPPLSTARYQSSSTVSWLSVLSPVQTSASNPRPAEGAVQDQADLLTTQEEADLNRLIGDKNTENEYIRAAVLTVNDTQGEDIEEFSRRVATDWGVGEDGRNNAHPQFTDHYFTGEYPTRLLDREIEEGGRQATARQLSLLVSA